MFHKSIFQGKIEFDNPRSYSKGLKMFRHRVDNYHKSIELIFEEDEIFNTETMTMEIPRTVLNVTEKAWKTTVSLLKYTAQFAISGNIGAWMIEDGKLLHFAWIEPKSDKAVVKNYQQGKKLSSVEGREKEAMELLTTAIEGYDKHSQAYERRGYLNYIIKNFHDAERDFTKAIEWDDSNAAAYLGRARLKMKRQDYKESLKDLELAIKYSLALQDIHWHARRLKADCLIHLEDYKNAEFELRFFNKRDFDSESRNRRHVKASLYKYALVQKKIGNEEGALNALKEALEIDSKDQKYVTDGDIYVEMSLSKKALGKNGHLADLKRAVNLGNNRAKGILENR
jgi:tetratricopeptide (TPR) repeat protein